MRGDDRRRYVEGQGSLPRSGGALKQACLRVNLNITHGIVGVVVEDLIPLHVLPILTIAVVEMNNISRNTGL